MTDYIMYEINWHWSSIGDDESIFSGCTVSPIYVLDDCYFNPGATKPTILAKDSLGRKFTGSKDNYFESEKDAYDEIKRDLSETLRLHKSEIKLLQKQCSAIEAYLDNIDNKLG